MGNTLRFVRSRHFALWLLFVALISGFGYFGLSALNEVVKDANLTVLMSDVNETYSSLVAEDRIPEHRGDGSIDNFMERGTIAMGQDGERVLIRRKGRKCLVINRTTSSQIIQADGLIDCTAAMLKNFTIGKILDEYDNNYRGQPAYIAGRVIAVSCGKDCRVKYIVQSQRTVESAHKEANQILFGFRAVYVVVVILSLIGFWFLDRVNNKRRKSAVENKQMIESIPSGLIRINQQNVITFASPAMSKMFGYERGDMMGRHVHDIMPDRYKDKHDNGVDRVILNGHTKILGNPARDLMHGKKKDGSEFPCSLTVDKIEFPSQPFEFAGVFVDLSNEVEARDRIERKNEQLRMIGRVSRHDVLNNLSVVQTALAFIKEAGFDEETFDMAKDEADAAIELLQSLSVWSKLIESDGDSLTRVTESVNDMVNTVMPEGIKLDISQLGTIDCDKGLMQAVFRNVLENSSKYCPTDPEIRIWREGDVINIEDNSGGFACVDGVYDSGYAKRLMMPSQRGDHDVAGSGLGLANCQAILNTHGYSFSHTTTCGVGTVWHIQVN